jgi:hypothetical protein
VLFGFGGLVAQTAPSASAVAAPFSEDFSNWPVGEVSENFPVETNFSERIFIGEDVSGNRFLKLAAGSPCASAGWHLEVPEDFSSVA